MNVDLTLLNEIAQWIVLVWIVVRQDDIVRGLKNHKSAIEAIARKVMK